MGCDETREDIEEKMLYTRLEREEIRKQRKLLLEELRLSTGERYKKEKVPDFVDVEYIREKKKKHYEKLIKAEMKKVEEKEMKEKKRREEMEKELEEERKKEELLYMPLDMQVKNQNTDLEDIYYLNYVLEKRSKEKNKDKSKDKKHNNKKDKKSNKKRKKGKRNKDNSDDSQDEENEEKDKNDYMEPVNAKIQTKIGSVRSILGNNKDINNNKIIINNDLNNNDDNASDNASKIMPYVTPHLQPND